MPDTSQTMDCVKSRKKCDATSVQGYGELVEVRNGANKNKTSGHATRKLTNGTGATLVTLSTHACDGLNVT